MGVLSKLFGGGATTSKPRNAVPQIRFSGNFIDIPQRNFFGAYSRSPNGRFIIGWRDGNDEGTHGGARTSGMGRYILLEDGHIAVEGRMERPNDGKVADNGIFILNDWHFYSQELSRTFYAFRPNGEEILHRRFNANLYNNGLAVDGRYAVCQTCNSRDAQDSSILTIFDLERARELARWRPESGWASGYEFSDNGAHIRLEYPRGPKLAYTLSGEFLGRKAWIDEALAHGDAYMVARVLQEAGDGPPAELVRRLIASLDVGLKAAPESDARIKAYTFKLKGECFDTLTDFAAALQCYEAALSLDPKVGAKRRADQIRKMLAQGR